ncbi:RNA-directed DNA polymerase, eukaryota, reverse transcriptase zinc-binding domain protein [Tanacetum coccineum]
MDAGMFNGIAFNSVTHLSLMFYADDAVFMGQWSTKNIDTIIYVSKCFHRASGLSIHLNKSKLLGVVVSEDRVVQAANRIGCGVLKAPFAYLGSKVGGNMSRIKSWDVIVDKMVDRLSKWKMKTLSIGGRLTLLKAVLGSMPIYHMSIFKVPMKVLQRMESIRSRFFSGVDLNSKKSIWVKWSKVLCSKEKGGLGVSSLYALNRALMCKWVWRFTTQKNLLWTRVIKAIHGEDGKNGSGFKVGYKSIWRSILQEVETLKIKGIHLNNFMQKKLGNGADTYFWEDLWHGDMVLKQRYPRLYALEVKKTVDVASKLSQENLTWSFRRAPRSGVEQDQLTDLTTYVEGVVLGVTPDRWYWTLDGSGEFSVASARKVIDDNRFPEVSTQTRWIKAVPIKVNIHAWKVRMDCLPTRLNISRRGIDIPSILCPVCGSVTESSSHLFFDCLVAKDNFRKICRWWEVDFMEVHTFDEWVSWIVNLRIPIKHKSLLVLPLCLLKTSRLRSNLKCKYAIKRQRQEEDVNDEDLDLGERNIKQLMLPFEDLKTNHPFQPAPHRLEEPYKSLIISLHSSSTVVLDRIKSFPRGTSCERDGLRAQHLTDWLSGVFVVVSDDALSLLLDLDLTTDNGGLPPYPLHLEGFVYSAGDMAFWNSQREDHTSDWLRTVPISGLGQTMNAFSKVFAGDIYGDHVMRYKARLVANERNQQYVVDCSDTFSPVVKPATIRIVLSLALTRNWPVHQLDVKNAFLNGDLSKTFYMHQPHDFVDPRFPHHVYRLHRSLYGLKQALHALFQRFSGYALRVGFTSCRCDSSLFIYRHGTEVVYLLIYLSSNIYDMRPSTGTWQ